MSTLEAYDSHRRDQFQVRILEVLLLRRESQGSHASPTPTSEKRNIQLFMVLPGGWWWQLLASRKKWIMA